MTVISVANQKGGVCKTTTAQAIAGILNEHGKRTLAVDFDPQGNLSFAMGAVTDDAPTIYNVLKGELAVTDILQRTTSGDLLPANILLSGADTEFTYTGREYLLREALNDIKQQYEYIVIDCPPSLSVLTINAFVASDYVVVPSLADVFSMQGMGQLNNTIQSVRKYCNPSLKIAGILLTKFANRTNLGAHVREALFTVTGQMNTGLFKTTIRNSVSLQEAQLQQESLLTYDRKANALSDYQDFVNELEAVIHG